ncbi:MAG: sigma-54 dependent transcriptional regulator [Polyangia bacterium]
MANPARILIVDDNAEMARSLADGLSERGYLALCASSGREAIETLSSQRVDAVVTDLRMPSVDGMKVLAASRKLAPDRPVIIMTAFSAIEDAIESIRQGAYHYLTKPFKIEELVIFLGRALEEVEMRRETTQLRRALEQEHVRSRIVGSSAAMRAVRELIERVADAPAPVLILGETGTGKGLVARTIHERSSRAHGRFVSVNCASLPETLLESEMFGHVKGAFTGATSDRPGLFAEADGGTLLLDEIGDMAPGLQAKLLHVLESGVVRPVGSTKEHSVNVRVLAATHRDLRQAVRAGGFREDLFYRLDVVSIVVPPLRQRKEDIPEFVAHFLLAAKVQYPQSPVERFSPEALEALSRHPWPGNVRELAHTVERLVLLGRTVEIGVGDLPGIPGAMNGPELEFSGTILPIRELQCRYAAWALAQVGGHRGKAAEHLGIDAKTLWKWLQLRGDEGEKAQAASLGIDSPSTIPNRSARQ